MQNETKSSLFNNEGMFECLATCYTFWAIQNYHCIQKRTKLLKFSHPLLKQKLQLVQIPLLKNGEQCISLKRQTLSSSWSPNNSLSRFLVIFTTDIVVICNISSSFGKITEVAVCLRRLVGIIYEYSPLHFGKLLSQPSPFTCFVAIRPNVRLLFQGTVQLRRSS